MADNNLDFLRGSYTPLVVPFRDGEVDFEDYARLCEWQIENGANGLLTNATSGEPTTLTVEERYRLAGVAVEVSGGRVPVCVGTASESHAQTVEMIRRYNELQPDAIVVVTPFYCKPPDRAMVDYFVDVMARTDLPVMIYHIPGRAGVRLSVDTVAAIRDRSPNFAGLKNTDESTGLVTGILSRFPEMKIFSGMEQPTLAMLALGVSGAMISVSNVIPDRVAEMCRLFASGDIAGARKLNDAMSEIFASIGYDTPPVTTKYMVRRRGVISRNEHRLPMAPLTPELEKRLDGVLERAGLL